MPLPEPRFDDLGANDFAPVKSTAVKTLLTIWLLLFGMLLQSVSWALPVQRAEQAERLAHEVVHGIDHGHHQHDAVGHDQDRSLQLDIAQDDGHRGPYHAHVSDGVQQQGLPVVMALQSPALPCHAPRAMSDTIPPSADPAGLLRPPQTLA